MAKVSRQKSRTCEDSAEAANSASGLADGTIISFLLNGGAAEVSEDVFERCLGAHSGLEFGWVSDGGNLAEVQNGQLIAKLVGFVHGVGGDQNGHLKIAPQLEQAFPDGAAR